jgi:hypothetical protein
MGFHLGPPISGVIYDGTFTLVGEALERLEPGAC